MPYELDWISGADHHIIDILTISMKEGLCAMCFFLLRGLPQQPSHNRLSSTL